MTMTPFRFALGASLLVLTAGAALSDSAPAGTTQLASLSGQCAVPQAQRESLALYSAGTTARHTNVVRVRYTAAHAMPSKRPAVAEASCTNSIKTGTTALD